MSGAEVALRSSVKPVLGDTGLPWRQTRAAPITWLVDVELLNPFLRWDRRDRLGIESPCKVIGRQRCCVLA